MPRVQPRYKAIRSYLEEAIRNREFVADQQIPTEMALAERFGVSRMTANKAIAELVAEGYLVRHQGLGTFVAEVRAESPLLEIRNIADEIRDRRHVHSSELHRLEAVAVDAPTALRLGVREGQQAFHSLIVHRENGIPIQLEERFVRPEIAPDYLQQRFEDKTPSQYLSELYPLSEMEHIVEAILPDTETSKLLEIDTTEPCLRVDRRTWSDQKLVSCARLIHPGSRYRLSSRG
ncbi:histidine utilization repressor [Motiliproteus coralliicola]|uniref:Histidine utilization repressor n=1 Tax=Motiliproteus coralliicola TaxID=2283196 RepID=A0A369WQJ3_9GAMM|nr:histidine utilization repressor [Motiliproteus coralliicola]RDE22884.1 histidine utilization repressor [Motiliproteus coralliicola]